MGDVMTRSVLLSIALIVTSTSCAQQDAQSREPVTTIAMTIAVWPDTITLWRGDTLRFRAIAKAESDVVLDAKSVAWTSSDSSIVTIVEGLATAQRRGASTIVATIGNHAGS